MLSLKPCTKQYIFIKLKEDKIKLMKVFTFFILFFFYIMILELIEGQVIVHLISNVDITDTECIDSLNIFEWIVLHTIIIKWT